MSAYMVKMISVFFKECNDTWFYLKICSLCVKKAFYFIFYMKKKNLERS